MRLRAFATCGSSRGTCHDGGLDPVAGGPVSSGGIAPVSVAVHGRLVYVANAGDGGSDYTGFTLNPGGRLRPLAGSTVALPDGSSPGDVLFNGDGTKLIGTRVNSSLIDSFTVGHRGVLTAAPGSPFAAQGLGPFDARLGPGGATLWVVEANAVAALAVAGGDLAELASSPTPLPAGATPFGIVVT